jgi:hypothetical protein
MSQKGYKLIREIKEIIDNQELHFWIKCKQLVKIKTYNRPGSYEGGEMIREFFKTCAMEYKDRFESAYVRPYFETWEDRSAYDYVNNDYLNKDPSAKIGRNPRGIKLAPTYGHVRRAYESSVRFSRYLKRKYPEAFETFEEIKKVEHHYGSAMERTEDCAWQHIFPRVQERDVLLESETYRGRTTKKAQIKRRKLDLAMKKAQADYKKLEKASKLLPRYLYNEISLAELQNDHKNHTYTIFKKHYYITIDTTLHYDDSDVHHGLGKLTHTDRVLRIRDRDGMRLCKILKTYSGNFVLNAIEKHFRRKIKKVKVADELKPVQLNPKMDILELSSKRSFRRFQRLFAHNHYDYCVLKDGITYHGSSVEMCEIGWKKKKTLSKAGAKIINMKTCMALGFCSTGVRSFCSSNSIDSHESYTVEELKKIVKKNLSYNRMYFGHELKQIGIL